MNFFRKPNNFFPIFVLLQYYFVTILCYNLLCILICILLHFLQYLSLLSRRCCDNDFVSDKRTRSSLRAGGDIAVSV